LDAERQTHPWTRGFVKQSDRNEKLILRKIETVTKPFRYGLTDYSGFYEVRPVDNPGVHIRIVKEEAIMHEDAPSPARALQAA
jgi:hypothetical protein